MPLDFNKAAPSPFGEDPLYQTLPDELKRAIHDAAAVNQVSPEQAAELVQFIDHTSLKGYETREDIEVLCKEALDINGPDDQWLPTAAICVYGHDKGDQVSYAAEFLAQFNIFPEIAAVNAFPEPYDWTPEEIYEDAQESLAAGATEIDTVLDVLSFEEAKDNIVREKLRAVRRAIDEHNQNLPEGKRPARLKTIMNGSAFKDYDGLYAATMIALEEGADFVKTSTGMPIPFAGIERDNATLPVCAVLLQAIVDFEQETGELRGFKAAGGYREPIQGIHLMALVKNILNVERLKPYEFRIGASQSFRESIMKQVRPLKLSQDPFLESSLGAPPDLPANDTY